MFFKSNTVFQRMARYFQKDILDDESPTMRAIQMQMQMRILTVNFVLNQYTVVYYCTKAESVCL